MRVGLAHIHDFIMNIPLFADLNRVEADALASHLLRKEYRKGEAVFFEGDPGNALYLVQSGTVKIYRIAEDGREKTLVLLGAGDFFGEMAVFDDEPRSATAQVLENSVLLILSRQDFLQFLAEHPSASRHMLKALSHRLRDTNAQLMDVAFRDVRGRLAKVVLELADRHGVPDPAGLKIDLKLTHQELANLVGTARETVTRVLAEWQDLRCLTIDGRFLVLREIDVLKAMTTA